MATSTTTQGRQAVQELRRQRETITESSSALTSTPTFERSDARPSTFTELQGRITTLGLLRQERDKLLNETLANNPLQIMASKVLTPLADRLSNFDPISAFALGGGQLTGKISGLDILENVGKGAAIGSVILPDDVAVDPSNPVMALQVLGIALGAMSEGFTGDLALLSGLNALKVSAAARGAKNLSQSAEAALKLFGQGENASTLRQAMGGAALAGTTEVGLQAAGLQDPESILINAGLVATGGAILGGAIAGVSRGRRAMLNAPRVSKTIHEAPFGVINRESMDRQISKVIQDKAYEQGMTAAHAKNSIVEAGVGSETAYIQRLDRQARAIGQSKIIGEKGALPAGETPKLTGRTQNPKVEGLFDQSSNERFVDKLKSLGEDMGEKWKNTFIYETKLTPFPHTTGVKGLTLADNVRELQHGVSKASRDAVKQLQLVTSPLQELKRGEPFTAGWRSFERVIVLRDLLETAERGLPLPKGLTLEEVRNELYKLEGGAPKQVLEAAELHRQTVNEMREDLIRRGKLEVGDGYDNYFPHQIINDLSEGGDAVYPTTGAFQRGAIKEPTRPYTFQRLGSEKAIKTDYVESMYKAVRRWNTDNVIDDFIGEMSTHPSRLERADLLPEELKSLITRKAFVRNGQTYKIFHPRGSTFYRAGAVDKKSYEVFMAKIESELGISIADVPELKDVFALARGKEFIFPAELVDRLNQFHGVDELLAPKTLANAPRIANAWWKRNTIWWGLMRFAVFQVLGDSVNLLKSNPGAFVKIRNGKLDSSALRAINEIAQNYGMPLMSREQAVGALAGGVGGLTIDEALGSEDPGIMERVSSILAGAGLGYIIGSRRVAGTRRAFSEIYDEADKWAAINSGFVFSEEELSRRTLGEMSSYLPTTSTPEWKRTLDSVATLLSGKVHGDPYAPFRIPAEIVEVAQTERENWLRLANYMDMVADGIEPRLAAKRSREILVDYGKFTETENKYFRGFWLPFYSFYRHNIPNWIKAATNRDVGGKTTVAMVATGAIAAADIAVQEWNERFFPEIEKRLQDFRKDRFHIIIGNPVSGEAYTDKAGRPMILGWEMPYEEALEFFGLARPGVVYSELLGLRKDPEGIDLVQRSRQMTEDIASLKKGPGALALDLLTPFIKEPVSFYTNQDFFYDSPIVPERYLATDEARAGFLKHAAETFFRQYREFNRLGGDIKGKRFDPLTSAIGLGIPLYRVNLDRDIQGFIHEQIDEAQLSIKQIDAKWKKEIDDILYEREDFAIPAQGELNRIMTKVNGLMLPANETEKALRYYQNKGGMGSLTRRWKSLSAQEKVETWNRLPKWAQTALGWYTNTTESLAERIAPKTIR